MPKKKECNTLILTTKSILKLLKRTTRSLRVLCLSWAAPATLRFSSTVNGATPWAEHRSRSRIPLPATRCRRWPPRRARMRTDGVVHGWREGRVKVIDGQRNLIANFRANFSGKGWNYEGTYSVHLKCCLNIVTGHHTQSSIIYSLICKICHLLQCVKTPQNKRCRSIYL